MPERPDYYAILQVHPTVTKEVIDAAYRKLASKYHPDVNTSAEAENMMKLLNEAYEILSDPSKRSAYDHYKPEPKTNISWNWRKLIIPLCMIVLILFAVRVGFRLALIFLVGLGILWVVNRIGK